MYDIVLFNPKGRNSNLSAYNFYTYFYRTLDNIHTYILTAIRIGNKEAEIRYPQPEKNAVNMGAPAQLMLIIAVQQFRCPDVLHQHTALTSKQDGKNTHPLSRKRNCATPNPGLDYAVLYTALKSQIEEGITKE